MIATKIAASPVAALSPRLKARIAGALYLIPFLGFAEAVRSNLVVDGDPAATATNILAHESLFRLAFAADLVGLVCYIAVTVLLYDLLKPVNRTLALLAAFLSVAASTIQSVILLAHMAPLFLLSGARYLTAFTGHQLQAMAYVSLELHGVGYNIDLVFFGVFCVLVGYLIFASTFMPRIVGVLVILAGLSYLINSFAQFLAPAFADRIYPYVLFPAFGEVVLALWLLVMGVDAQKWTQMASSRRP
jgi:hypothetical protein